MDDDHLRVKEIVNDCFFCMYEHKPVDVCKELWKRYGSCDDDKVIFIQNTPEQIAKYTHRRISGFDLSDYL